MARETALPQVPLQEHTRPLLRERGALPIEVLPFAGLKRALHVLAVEMLPPTQQGVA